MPPLWSTLPRFAAAPKAGRSGGKGGAAALFSMTPSPPPRLLSSAAGGVAPGPPRALDGADWIDPRTGLYRIFTDNAFVSVVGDGGGGGAPSPSSGRFQVVNPANQDVLGTVLDAAASSSSPPLLDELVRKGREAHEGWRAVPVQRRQRVLADYALLVKEATPLLAELICLENGKTLADARGDVFRGLEVVESSAGAASRMLGSSLLNLAEGVDCASYRVPVGVCAAVCPFNFPAMIPLWSFPLAAACGNACLVKPSERTPSASLVLARLAAEAGLPPNVLQVVPGGPGTVRGLCEHPGVDAVTFVGGDRAGRAVHRWATGAGKRALCNLGAKNHAVVLPDAPLGPAARAVAGAAFGAAGQRCMALSVAVLVGPQARDRLVPEIVNVAKQIRVGPGWDPSADLGPLVSRQSLDRVAGIVDRAVNEEGAILHLDGRSHAGALELRRELGGNFMGPTVLEVRGGDLSSSTAYAEEIFGPVLVCVAADSFEDAVRIVNANPYGNGASIFTSSGSAARQFVSEVEAGQVGINAPIPVPLPMFSFTGNKASVVGDHNFYGQSGVNFFTQLKTVTSHWPPYRDPSSSPPLPSSAADPSSSPSGLGAMVMPTPGGEAR